MDIQQKIANRLKNEREELSLTLKSVSKKLGFNNYQTLSSIESGEREVKAWELAKLSKIYGRDIDYFLDIEPTQTEPQILWRNPESSTEKGIIERRFIAICRKFQNLKKINKETERSDTLLPLSIDKHQLRSINAFKYVDELALNCLKILNLGCRPAYSLVNILEEKLAYKIIFLPMDSGLSGGSVDDSSFGKAILINSNDSPWRRNFDITHEFFHLITWENFDQDEIYPEEDSSKSRVEQLADAFASAFLLPEEEVRSEFETKAVDKSISYLNLVEIARDFKVSTQALLWRLVNLDLIKKENVHEELEKGHIMNVDKRQRIADWETEKPYLSNNYISLAIKAFHQGIISKGKLAEYVNVEYSEIPSFLKRYGYDENVDYSVAYSTT